jgi:TctA family transporter
MAGLLVFKQFCVYNKEMRAIDMLVNLTIDIAMYMILFIAFPRATLVLFLVLEGIAMIQRRRSA